MDKTPGKVPVNPGCKGFISSVPFISHLGLNSGKCAHVNWRGFFGGFFLFGLVFFYNLKVLYCRKYCLEIIDVPDLSFGD